MKIGLLATSALALAACASYSGMAVRPVAYSAMTSKTPDVYVTCALPKMLDFSASAHIVQDGAARVIVLPVGGGTPNAILMTITATPDAGSTRVELRHMRSLSDFHRGWEQAQACL